ncbi:MAG: hypothetical protein BGO31_07540 [Bacteroidetes bacterium 43-16]|nr:MAG: hypothetical protein BGO31_07540 [Bacteroidetes bacterium 43-16]
MDLAEMSLELTIAIHKAFGFHYIFAKQDQKQNLQFHPNSQKLHGMYKLLGVVHIVLSISLLL